MKRKTLKIGHEYPLFNRYHEHTAFEIISENTAKFIYKSEYIRVADRVETADKITYQMIDPSGGPAIFVGSTYTFDNITIVVEQIYFDKQTKNNIIQFKYI